MYFCREGYSQLVSRLVELGYRTIKIDSVALEPHELVLRHDVDFCLRRSVELAEIEASLGVSSHYYVLVNSKFYNAAHPDSRALIKRLTELGHYVGLHFDSSPYENSSNGLDISSCEVAAAELQCNILSEITQRPVTSLSFHRPIKALLGLDRMFAGRLHSYQPKYFNQMEYISDSTGEFRFGAPLSNQKVLAGHPLQLLIHPVWWIRDVSHK